MNGLVLLNSIFHYGVRTRRVIRFALDWHWGNKKNLEHRVKK